MAVTDTISRPDLHLSVRDQRFIVRPGQGFSFGRSESCDLCLDTIDRGISRVAGSFMFEHGAWWVVNRSENRALYLVDPVGISTPLPVTKRGEQPSRRSIDPQGISVLVAGAVWTHELRCSIPDAPSPRDEASRSSFSASVTQIPSLTDARKEVLVALVSGYLRPFPRHDPRPLTYAEIAQMVGLPRTTVTKRIEATRSQLREHGIPGLDDDDARRPLAEWLLAMRLIVPGDLEWLETRRTHNTPKAGDLED